MADLGTKLDLARSLFAPAPTQSTATIKGTVMADSSGGSVSVKIGEVEYDDDGNIIVPESELIATIPIIGSASTGDEVTVIVEDGSPTAIAAPGWGDSIEEKTQHITFEDSGDYAGLHIHENASDYTIGSDLYLNSNVGLNLMIDEDLIAQFSPSGIYFAETPNQAGIDLNGEQFFISPPVPHHRISIPYERGSFGITVNDRSFIDALTELYILCTDTAEGSWTDITIAAGVGTESASIKMCGITYSEDPKFTNYTNIDIEARNIGLSLGRGLNINSDPGTSGQVLTSQGSGNPPIWSTVQGGGADPATSAPIMDGTAAVGTSTKYAREDHVHPSDTSKQDTLVSGTNIKTVNGNSLLGSGDVTIQSGSLPFCFAIKGSYGTSATSSTITTVQMTAGTPTGTAGSNVPTSGYISDSTAFEVSSGGIMCKKAGWVSVAGSLYISGGTIQSAAYIFQNNSERFGSGYWGQSTGAQSVRQCQGILQVAAGDVIYIKSRSNGSSTVVANWATYLKVEYLEI